MASLVLGAVGAFIGAPFGLSGLGFMIGSSLGSWLTAPDQYGPKLGEVKVQSSSFGTPLPIPYGIPPPFAGTVIWEDQIQTHQNSQSAGGKGGPQVITYTYTQSYAIAICEGPVAAIVRVWKNGKLIYNVGSGADAATLAKLPSNLKLYLGTSTQLPDPTLEAVLGVGKVSAYRGTVYAVLTNDDVTANGGIAWQYKFEVATAGSMAATPTWESYASMPSANGGGYRNDVAPFADADGVHIFRLVVVDYPEGSGVHRPTTPGYLEHWIAPYTGAIYKVKGRPGGTTQISVDNSTGSFNGIAGKSFAATKADEAGVGLYVYNATDAQYYVAWMDAELVVIPLWQIADHTTRYLVSMAKLTGHYLFIFWDYNTSKFILYFDGMKITFPTGDDGVGSGGSNRPIYVSANYFWIVSDYGGTGTTKLHRYNLTGQFVDATTVPAGIAAANVIGVMDDDHVIIAKLTSGVTDWYLYSLSGAAFGPIWIANVGATHGSDYAANDNSPWYNGVFPRTSNAVICFASTPASASHSTVHRFTSKFTPSDVLLSTVQTDVCTRCGLTTDEIDVTQLTDVVQGYAVMGRMAGRAASEPLAAAYFYDAGEWDGKLNFIKRGAASAGLIPLDDLSAHSFGSQPPDPVVKTRNDRAVLPTQVDVNYYNPANDNQAGLQTARRFTVNNDNPITLSFSTLVLSDAYAKGVAEVNLFNFWANANPVQFSVGPKWQHVTPTDVHDVENYGTVRITNKHEAVNGVIQFDAVTEQPSIYPMTAVGSGGTQTGQTSVAFQGPTRLELMDIPILRDEDDDYGFYVGVDGFLIGWKSGTVFKSIDGGSTYDPILTDSDPGVMGYTSTALADWTRGNVLDTQSVVRVELDVGDTLSSCTPTQLLQNANPCMFGNEMCQYMTATLVSTGVYDVSMLLRGRKGTEWACTGHVIGERFVMLDSTTVKRVGAPATDIALALDYKGVTAGSSIASAPKQAFTNSGIGKKCYAPALLRYYKDTDGSWWLTWQRRSRIDNQWHAYANEPLGETTENYQVDIYDSTGTTFKRTYAVTAKTVHYLLADVTTDGTSTHFVAKVYQIGALGRGYAGTLTV